ncbi:hypothetical protein PtA15_10A2 [Puccinia triticina]|uniref:PX domain-containing protein n=1 Tax=Puccinia triticina TaxID=208348 RepID=A0ABY7CTG8_9BASI|nr:uncharacterized protein PtA15_10A2 [Puccinia triticina]WAQ88583.1 hypothetical protein PtA15_10A2 [Puccinia triticina]
MSRSELPSSEPFIRPDPRGGHASPQTDEYLPYGHPARDHHPRMSDGQYGAAMLISASHLDRQINTFIQETSVISPQPAESSTRPSDWQQQTRHASSPEQDSDDDDGHLPSNAPHAHLRMAGSRPPSRAALVRRRSRAPSTSSSFVDRGQESQTPGYLFLNEVPPLRIKKSTLANHPPPLHSPKQKGKAPTHSRATSHHRRADDQQQRSDRAQRAIESNPAEFGIGSAEQDLKAPIDIFKSPQHAWYFVRRLVGLELRWEAARAWKLTDLNSSSVDTSRKEPSNHHSRVRSNDDQSSYSWDSSSGETTVAAENLPILTYLIQNFLLTLPIIRDTVSVVPNVPHSSHFNPQAPANHTSVAVYWTAGVLPILRRLHQSNLSAVIDLGSPGFLHILFDSHIARLIERSVATSLKLCTQTPRFHKTPNPVTCGAGELASEGTRRPRSLDDPEVTSPEKNQPPQNEETPDPSNEAGRAETHYFKDITPLAVSHPPDPGTPEREQPRTYVHNFEKEPQRYSGISVQPSQRASIGIVTPSNSNSMPDSHEAHPLNRTENFSVGFLTHEMQKTGVTPSNTPSSKTFSSTSTYDRHPTDTEISTFMPSVFGSIQESPLAPSWSKGFNQLDASIGKTKATDSFHYRKSVPAASATSEEVKSVRQTIERMKMERQNNSEHGHEDDNKHTGEIDTDSELKRASKWGFTLKSLSLLRHSNTVRAPEDPKKAFRRSWRIKSENAPKMYLPPSPDALSLKFSQSASPQVSDTPFQKVTVPESLVKGLSSPYEKIYQPESFQFQFELLEMPKDSVPWPWGDPVPFWKGTPVHKLSWGGFEVDLVGIRQGIGKNSFVIRVRRPSRLDEYVLRKESQFKNYCRRLSKDFPNAHVRAVPPPEISLEDDLSSLDALLQEDEHQLVLSNRSDGFGKVVVPQISSESRMVQPLSDLNPNLSGNPCFVDPFTSLPVSQEPVIAHEEIKRRATLASIFGVGNHKSKFSLDTRSDWNGSNRMGKNLTDARNERVTVDREIVGSAKQPKHPGHSRRGSLRQIKVSSDTHRRALRGWLRDTLSIRAVGHHPETAAFLLLGSVVPEEKDLLDIRQREMIDEERRNERLQVAQGAAERSKTIHEWWSEMKNEFVDGEGLQNLSNALKQGSSVEELPLRFQKALEWIRMNIAEGLHELLVIGNQSDILFGKLLGLNAAIPWSLIKNVLKIKKPNLMCKALLEVFLNKKSSLGKSKPSVIQRLIEIAINETEGSFVEVERRIQACRARIQSLTMCEKIIKFVHASKDLKNLFRRYSESADIELVVAIVRSAEEPRLDKYDLERVMSASKAFKSLLAKNRNRITSSMTENIHVRLILDLKLYLRLISQEWDSKQIRKMFSEDSVAEALEVLISPMLEFLKRTYNTGNAVQALDDAQSFIEQLITVVNALRSRIQGLLQPILVSEIVLPVDLDELSDELDEIVEWEETKRKRQYEQLCRRYSADVDGDDPVIIEGDGFGRSKVEPLVDPKPLPPQLDHIASCLELFRAAIGKALLRR